MKELIYNMTNYKYTIKSLGNLIGVNDIEDYVKENKDNISYEDFCKHYNIDINKINIKGLYLVGMHVTTNTNGCKDIKDYGIISNYKVLNKDTELKRYLKDKNIIINFKNKNIKYNNLNYSLIKLDTKEYKYNNEFKPLRQLISKIYNDDGIDFFVCSQNPLAYPGGIKDRPEILYNISELFKDKSIEDDWKKSIEMRTYLIFFKVNIYDINYWKFAENESSFDKNKDFYIKRYLIQESLRLINRVINNEGIMENILTLKKESSVKHKDILFYIEMN